MKKRRFKLTRNHIAVVALLFAIWMYTCANKKEVDNGFFPPVQLDKEDKAQLDEMKSYHSDKGLAIEDNGFLIIKIQ